ncbi:PaaI family thioesterase [Agathobaculum sp. Marseille-P7918]|uniref:PaaI family thioesterase n=1 Tax=Agathobaculum sp. Marseille-P7918 TaxID=2479843 RepID=UPI000F63C46F|nr:PaaI family thioesterase [Agathobaculum sp. Marseille-P7918]
MPTLEQIRATFAADRFATDAAGCEIRLAEPGHSVCAMTLRPHHLNAAGTPQGGAIFTLADFAFAVAVNAFAETVTVSLQHDITFLSAARGTELIAEANCVRSGRSTCFYTVTVADNLDTVIAEMTVNGFVTRKKIGE